MSQPVTIITGASRGMGAAMAQQLLDAGHRVLTIARHTNESLSSLACEQWVDDLVDAAPVAQRVGQWLAARVGDPCSSITLINNAALLGSPGPIETASSSDLQSVLRVGLEAPMLLTSAFLRATQAWTCPRRALNISSGLGRWAMAGSAAYCAAKAGLDHFSRVVALEQAKLPNGAKVVSLAPGVIATDMQAQLRDADASVFPERERFVALHEQGQLASAEVAAQQVLAFLERADFGENVVADVRDA